MKVLGVNFFETQCTYNLRGAVTFPEYVISDILMVNIGTGTFMSLAPLDVSLAPPPV